ncbi:uncharacterized protein A1O9_07273 [Exophiala aquamarina CBS 119918]|uniref:AMP-dependent synthetase/ligase domain-containing protein n=1 Tax=Exophiala aquamarina CBS 119918 TaxID=1182545 RepID=A0A072PCR3_9EURO|nr:uncharacterized protein A1O9_07273 [Exophiala aquamarina CBS 119918]KEF57083.1 hypothetical protein A1O9_07273 [Exophiala aquamarina CBS 119918]
MASTSVIQHHFSPLGPDERITIPELFGKYNPDYVPASKVVHIDTLANKSITYGGLRDEAAKGAWGLKHNLGMKEQDRLLVLVPNSTDFIVLCHSTLWLGAIFSPLNIASLPSDIAHSLSLIRPTHLAIDPAKLNHVKKAFEILDWSGASLPIVFTVTHKSFGLKLFPEDISGRSPNESLRPFQLGNRSAKDVTAMVMFSSGTTGKTKGVQLSHYNIVSSLIQVRAAIPTLLNYSTRGVFFAPYCHIYGMSTVVLSGMYVGNFTCGIPTFDFNLYCSKMAEYEATMAHIVPPIAIALANWSLSAKYDLSSLKVILIGAAPTKKALQIKLKARFGYGLTECSPSVTVQSPLDNEENIGTIGRLIPGTDARLVDPVTFKDVPFGEEGELWLKGPQVMMGYYRNPEATKATFSGGWLRTGDVMRLDEHQNLWVTDRLKEMIKYKGFQVPPSELEDLLLKHSSVMDAAVTSIYSDEQATEIPIAYVTLVNDIPSSRKPQTLQYIREWFDGQVVGYKKLRGGIWELNPIPKTASGKILRQELPCKKVVAASRATKL